MSLQHRKCGSEAIFPVVLKIKGDTATIYQLVIIVAL